jgi:hypothetical protein
LLACLLYSLASLACFSCLLALLAWFSCLLACLLTWLVCLLAASEFSLGGSIPYTSTDNTSNIHEWNNTKHSKYKYTYYQNTHNLILFFSSLAFFFSCPFLALFHSINFYVRLYICKNYPEIT